MLLLLIELAHSRFVNRCARMCAILLGMDIARAPSIATMISSVTLQIELPLNEYIDAGAQCACILFIGGWCMHMPNRSTSIAAAATAATTQKKNNKIQRNMEKQNYKIINICMLALSEQLENLYAQLTLCDRTQLGVNSNFSS